MARSYKISHEAHVIPADLPVPGLGKLPVNTQISAYYNVVKPDFGANWQIRAQVQLMFPK